MRRIIIIGAGLGGLALAQGLKRRGFDVALYERDSHPNARPQGYRIQLDEPGLTGLRECLPPDLFELAIATAAAPPPRVTVRNRRLDVLSDPAAANQSRATDISRPHAFDRSTLRQILLSGLDDNVHFGAHLVDYADAGGAVTAGFADGRVAIGDVLVGADGVGSAVRRSLLPDAVVEDAGLRLIYGKIPLDDATAAQVPAWIFENIFNVVVGGPGHPHIGIGPLQLARRPDQAGLPAVDDYLAFMVGAPADHPAVPAADHFRHLDHHALRDVAGRLIDGTWDPALRRMLDLWRAETVIPLTISTAAPVSPWAPGRVTLIGDAVHAMSPVLAMGANTAIRDARELALALGAAPDDPVEALCAYQDRMLGYALPLVAASRSIGRTRVGQR
jgi:2-polyprenyl-6-methoxyphenol hydroxylase-like FAD-dependent oxidoreductase